EVAATQQADAARAQAILEGKTPPPAPAVKKEAAMLFYLQAGSFSERSAAESVRAQLLLSGQQVHIEPGQVADKTWHRVLVGPFASREQLDVAQKQLASNGFNNLLLQQRKVCKIFKWANNYTVTIQCNRWYVTTLTIHTIARSVLSVV